MTLAERPHRLLRPEPVAEDAERHDPPPATSRRRTPAASTFRHCQGCTGSGTPVAGRPLRDRLGAGGALRLRDAARWRRPPPARRPRARSRHARTAGSARPTRARTVRARRRPQPSRPLLATALGWPYSRACRSSVRQGEHASPSVPRQRARRDASAWRVRPTSRTKPAVAGAVAAEFGARVQHPLLGVGGASLPAVASKRRMLPGGYGQVAPDPPRRRRSDRSRRRPGAASLRSRRRHACPAPAGPLPRRRDSEIALASRARLASRHAAGVRDAATEAHRSTRSKNASRRSASAPPACAGSRTP